ncbi:YciI family protein [Chloroflexota bacterium]
MADFIVTAPLAEDYRQALEKAYSDVEAGKPLMLPDDMALSRESHLQYMEQLKAAGKLLCAGPLAGFIAAVLIFVDVTREEVEQIMEKHPHIQTGFLVGWEVKEWQRRI